MMTSLFWRVSRSHILTSLGLGLLLLLGIGALMIHREAIEARKHLAYIGHGVLSHLPVNPADFDSQTITEVSRYCAIFGDEDNMHVTIYTADGLPLYRNHEMGNLAAYPRDGSHVDRFFRRPGAFEFWPHILRCDTATYIVLLRADDHEEEVRELAYGGLLCLGMLIIVSLLLGYRLTRVVIGPVEAITAAVGRIQQGDLTARITVGSGQRELRELAGTMNATFTRLEELFNQVNDFSANAAHELRTPLTALRGNLEVCLRRVRTPEEYQETLVHCVDELTALQKLVDTLLLLSRSTAGPANERFEAIAVTTLCQGLIEQTAALAADTGITLVADLAPGVRMQGVPALLYRMYYNLIHNAIKFSPPASRVEIRLRSADGQVVFAVADHGPGLAPELQGKIFERFYQVDRSRQQGMGLGLALVKWGTALHCGTVGVVSQPGNGSVFTIRLPAGCED